MRRLALYFVSAGLFLGLFAMAVHSEGGPKLGEAGRGPVIDKSGDATLQKMIAEVMPEFRQLEFKSADKTLKYNLYTPKNAQGRLPLVLFMADASTPGPDVKSPLTQGYGGLIWATPENQAKNPCYVLVPQFSGVAVNDSYQISPEVDLIIPLLKDVVSHENIDPKRIYATGQSMGGMIAMYLNTAYPDQFAASLFVDCHWDPASFGKLIQRNFIFMVAGDQGKAFADIAPLEEAARNAGRAYTTASWSARLPIETQDDVAQTMLAKGAPINIFGFDTGTVLPENGKGSEHMYSFDCAYRLAPLRDWLFGFGM